MFSGRAGSCHAAWGVGRVRKCGGLRSIGIYQHKFRELLPARGDELVECIAVGERGLEWVLSPSGRLSKRVGFLAKTSLVIFCGSEEWGKMMRAERRGMKFDTDVRAECDTGATSCLCFPPRLTAFSRPGVFAIRRPLPSVGKWSGREDIMSTFASTSLRVIVCIVTLFSLRCK